MNEELNILTLNLKDAWNAFKIESIDLHPKTFNEARFGIEIKFDITDYLNGRIQTKNKKGLVQVGRNWIGTEELETELIKREKIIKDYLIEMMKEEDIVSPRGG